MDMECTDFELRGYAIESLQIWWYLVLVAKSAIQKLNRDGSAKKFTNKGLGMMTNEVHSYSLPHVCKG